MRLQDVAHAMADLHHPGATPNSYAAYGRARYSLPQILTR